MPITVVAEITAKMATACLNACGAEAKKLQGRATPEQTPEFLAQEDDWWDCIVALEDIEVGCYDPADADPEHSVKIERNLIAMYNRLCP